LSNYKIYRIKYILSNGKPVIHFGKRDKIAKEYEEMCLLNSEQILRKLKLHKEKDKDIKLVEVEFIDWAGNLVVSKGFGVDEEEEKECNNSE